MKSVDDVYSGTGSRRSNSDRSCSKTVRQTKLKHRHNKCEEYGARSVFGSNGYEHMSSQAFSKTSGAPS